MSSLLKSSGLLSIFWLLWRPIYTIMNSSSVINTNPINSRGDFLPAVKPGSFGRKLPPAVWTLLSCIYVLFIQCTCSTYFLFSRVFFLVSISHNTNRSQQCCILDGLHSSTYFQVLKFFYQSFGDCTNSTNYNWYNCHFYVLQFYQFSIKVEVLNLLFAFFPFSSEVSKDNKILNTAS